MKRDFLKELGISEDLIDKIMAENGKDIEATKAKYADYDDIKSQLEGAKADVDKWKAEYDKAVAEGEQKIKRLERQGLVKDYMNGKKFVNAVTKDALGDKLLAELDKDESKGKSLDDLFKALTEGMENIIVDDNAPQPPTVPGMAGKPGSEDGVLAAFKRNNPGIKIDL